MFRRFRNLDPTHEPHGAWNIFRWGILERIRGQRRVEPPGEPAPRATPDLDLVRDHPERPTLTWIGHCSFLATVGGARVLIDPVFSGRVGWVYPRYGEPGFGLHELPPVDALLVTHSHYDHLDRPSVLALPREVPVFVPSKLGRWFRRQRFRRVKELDWWECTEVGPLRVTLVPSCHWSRRRIADTNFTLWGGFVVQGGGKALYHAGDTAWYDGFGEIGRRFPGIDAAMLPVGAYAPGWFMEHYHLNPEQAGQAFLDLGAKRFIPMHWGAFQLTDEPLCEPVDRVRAWWASHGRSEGRTLVIPAVGETVVLDDA